MRHEQRPRGKRDHDLLRELQIIRFRWSRVRREAEDGAQEVVGRGPDPTDVADHAEKLGNRSHGDRFVCQSRILS